MNFEQLGVIPTILTAIENQGYTNPTPIQEKAIPIVLNGNDLIGCAQTGTGKTAAFSIPILQLLYASPERKKHGKIRSLIVTPTRELAIQIGESIKLYGQGLNIRHAVIFGGVSQHNQVNQLKSHVDILIATPGRLLDLIQQGFVKLNDLEIFVLDEADRMLDMGFIHDIKKIIKLLPQKRQNLFFSATMPKEIIGLANTILTDPKMVEVTPIASTSDLIEQHVYHVDADEKKNLLIELVKAQAVEARVLVFTRTKHGADKVVKFLQKAQIKSAAIHGNKSQNARQNALNDFKNKNLKVLVATDIAARGIDIDDLEMVLNYEIPNIPETYVHRIGRTGRAGVKGVAISFCDQTEKNYLKLIQKLTKKELTVKKA